jgi:hypothetical protein
MEPPEGGCREHAESDTDLGNRAKASVQQAHCKGSYAHEE